MKKIALLIAAVLLVSGCSQEYTAEKAFWKARTELKKVKKSDIATGKVEVLDPSIRDFQKIADRFPGTSKAAESLFVVVNLKIMEKKYDEAHQTLTKIIQNYSGIGTNAPEARDGIARLYEVQGDWAKAEQAYWELAEYHPLSEKGLQAPINVLVHYQKVKDAAKAQIAYDKAVDFYERTLKQVGPIQASTSVKNGLAVTHLTFGEWRKALEAWKSIARDFPNSPGAPIATLAAAELAMKKQEFSTAAELYQGYLEKYKKHFLFQQALMQTARIYAQMKQFAESRKYLDQLRELQKKDSPYLPQIDLMQGQSFQEEGQWAEADKIYEKILMQYPKSASALQVSFYRSQYYEAHGDAARSKTELDKAITRAMELAQGDNKSVAAFADRMLNVAYAQKGEWSKVLANFEENMRNEMNPARKGGWLFLQAVITENRIGDKAGALALYKDFITQYPIHPLTKQAKARVEALSKLPKTEPAV